MKKSKLEILCRPGLDCAAIVGHQLQYNSLPAPAVGSLQFLQELSVCVLMDGWDYLDRLDGWLQFSLYANFWKVGGTSTTTTTTCTAQGVGYAPDFLCGTLIKK